MSKKDPRVDAYIAKTGEFASANPAATRHQRDGRII